MGDGPKTPYNENFYAQQASGSRLSARIVLEQVRRFVEPTSVLDVGCGLGTWLAEWIDCGITDVIGVDGHYIDHAALHIPRERFLAADLSRPLDLGRKFDLVQSLEVAEHLLESDAEVFVDGLTRHGDTILFSAAIPRQGGTHHVNEQWLSYWVEKFGNRGFEVYDVIRPSVWIDRQVDICYRQNAVLFSRCERAESPGALDLVHPELWEMHRDATPTLSQIAREVPSAVKVAIRQRLLRASKR